MGERTDRELLDQDALPPTQYLVLETLAARWRLGHSCWTFPSRLRPALTALAGRGLVVFKPGIVARTCLVWLTDAGRDLCLDPAYVRPVDQPDDAVWVIDPA